MGKNAELFLKESNAKEIKKKEDPQSRKEAQKLIKSKKSLLSQLIGYFIMVVGTLYTAYRFENQEIGLPTTIVLVIISLFFGGIFILIGKHYS